MGVDRGDLARLIIGIAQAFGDINPELAGVGFHLAIGGFTGCVIVFAIFDIEAMGGGEDNGVGDERAAAHAVALIAEMDNGVVAGANGGRAVDNGAGQCRALWAAHLNGGGLFGGAGGEKGDQKRRTKGGEDAEQGEGHGRLSKGQGRANKAESLTRQKGGTKRRARIGEKTPGDPQKNTSKNNTAALRMEKINRQYDPEYTFNMTQNTR